MMATTRIKRAGQFVRHLDRYLLRQAFGFDIWHVNRLSDRPYARAVISYLNALPADHRGSVVEIGCGLGDIIRRLRFRHRLGLDADRAVLRAGRLLASTRLRTGLTFGEFVFPWDRLTGRFDAIIMVNWPHLFDADTVRSWITDCLREHLTPDGILIIDTVADPAYRFNHAIAAIVPAGRSFTTLGDFARQRQLWAVGGRDATLTYNAETHEPL
jgi:SAM-dependent methyltransferase